MKAFSPIYDATAIGLSHRDPSGSSPPRPLGSQATVLAPTGRPAAFRMAGLTTMMYAMATKVVAPPRMSFRMADYCATRIVTRSYFRAKRFGVRRRQPPLSEIYDQLLPCQKAVALPPHSKGFARRS